MVDVDTQFGLTLVAAPTAEPITRDLLKPYLRIDADDTSQDAVIDDCIASAREYAERYTSRQLMTATYKLVFDCFPEYVSFPLPPLQSVTTVKYIDTAGIQQTIDESLYTVDTISEPGLLWPVYGSVWPVTRDDGNVVEIVYKAGYANAEAIPPMVKQAIRLFAALNYRDREGEGFELDRINSMLRMDWTGEYR